MLLNYCAKTKEKITLNQIRDEVLAMLKVCFEGETEEAGDKLKLVLPDGSAFAVYVCEE